VSERRVIVRERKRERVGEWGERESEREREVWLRKMSEWCGYVIRYQETKRQVHDRYMHTCIHLHCTHTYTYTHTYARIRSNYTHT
jgi:prephenate dehydrogenase